MEDGRSHFINGEAMVSYLQVFKQLVEQLGWICELFGTLYSRAQRLKANRYSDDPPERRISCWIRLCVGRSVIRWLL